MAVMKQIVLHALGVDGGKSQQAQAQQGEGKKRQQQLDLQKEPPHKQLKTSKTVPVSQSLSNSMSANVSICSNSTSVQNSLRTHVTNSTIHYQNAEHPSAVRTPVSRMFQQAPTPTSVASSGIGSLNDEEAIIHSHKPVPHLYHTRGSLTRVSTTEHHKHDENSLFPTKQHSHPHARHKRTHSEHTMLSQEGRDAVNIHHSISDHHRLQNEVQKLTLSVEEEEIRCAKCMCIHIILLYKLCTYACNASPIGSHVAPVLSYDCIIFYVLLNPNVGVKLLCYENR